MLSAKFHRHLSNPLSAVGVKEEISEEVKIKGKESYNLMLKWEEERDVWVDVCYCIIGEEMERSDKRRDGKNTLMYEVEF